MQACVKGNHHAICLANWVHLLRTHQGGSSYGRAKGDVHDSFKEEKEEEGLCTSSDVVEGGFTQNGRRKKVVPAHPLI